MKLSIANLSVRTSFEQACPYRFDAQQFGMFFSDIYGFRDRPLPLNRTSFYRCKILKCQFLLVDEFQNWHYNQLSLGVLLHAGILEFVLNSYQNALFLSRLLRLRLIQDSMVAIGSSYKSSQSI